MKAHRFFLFLMIFNFYLTPQNLLAKSIKLDKNTIYFNKKINSKIIIIFKNTFKELSKISFEQIDYSLENFLDQSRLDSLKSVILKKNNYIVGNKTFSSLYLNLQKTLINNGIFSYTFLEKLHRKKNIAIPLSEITIIQVNPSLFLKHYKKLKSYDPLFAKLDIIINLFHENLHSSNFIQAHVLCPIGHRLAGQWACDDNLKSAYYYSQLFIQEIIKVCPKLKMCNKTTLDMLQLNLRDFKSRIL